ncbi:class I SAM-dependent methyltransferase [Hyphobacterium marinum]|uniref:Methyltransferase n=1 Tax=Hyphobacterium marinum TaxID=3116574 RepID=A0ABU7LY66_9PROT|nr:methyltransferase [Hyphobacterium sp. Y6023]MEE2566497.1 methyltransferase [Hyphobacterium sp. Y6023]
MSRILTSVLLAACAAGLSACGNGNDAPDEAGQGGEAVISEEAAGADAGMEAGMEAGDSDADTSAAGEAETGTLTWAVAGEWRGTNRERDVWRHPQETLEFLGVDPSGRVIEIWPGSGWYSEILAPWVAANGGTFVAATFPADSESERRREARASYEAHFASDPVYGTVEMADFHADGADLGAPGSADAILSFRNVHNWMGGGFAERAFADFYAALRPGGILGVIEHRLPDTREQDPRAGTGYVQEAYVIAMAREAGFEFVGSSEVNANPADTADHPFGVWTLPPTRRSAAYGEPENPDFDHNVYDAIGESDRMTLLFRKPETAEAGTTDGE